MLRRIEILSFAILVNLLTISGLSAQAVITGKIASPEPETKIKVSRADFERFNHQSLGEYEVNMADGTFRIEIAEKDPGVYRITYNRQYFLLPVKAGDKLDFQFDAGATDGGFQATGSKDVEEHHHLWTRQNELKLQYLQRLEDEYYGLLEEYRAAKKDVTDEAKLAELAKRYEPKMAEVEERYEVEEAKTKAIFIKDLKNTQSPLALYATLTQWDGDNFLADYKEIIARLKKDKTYADWDVVRQMAGRVQRFADTRISAPAPEIAQADTAGNTLALSSLKGQYVLVDFWASWCGPCRKENPNIVANYQQYKDKGFTILGVSLDKDKEAWRKAIEKDQLTWHHVSDLKGWASEPGFHYNVNSIPANVLVDPNGVIIAKNLRGEALGEKLAELFGGRP